MKVALVTTTSGENVAALMQALRPGSAPGDFDLVVDSGSVVRPKPAPDAYRFALEQLGEDAGACVAIEDNSAASQAARRRACTASPSPTRTPPATTSPAPMPGAEPTTVELRRSLEQLIRT